MPKHLDAGCASGCSSTPRECNQNEFSERLKSVRQQMQLSQKKLGELIGVSTVTIQQYENGNLPKSMHLAALSNSLNCTTDWLLFGPSDQSIAEVEEFDENIFIGVIEKLEDFLHKAAIKLPPAKKARVALLLYKASTAKGEVDTSIIETLSEVAS